MIGYYLVIAVYLLKTLRSFLQYFSEKTFFHAVMIAINFWLLMAILYLYQSVPDDTFGLPVRLVRVTWTIIGLILLYGELKHLCCHYHIVVKTKHVKTEYDLETTIFMVIGNDKA